MRLSLDALSVIDAIDRKGSFAAAAEELHRVPSAITYAVQKLEQDLGAELFDRSRHRAKLTPAGQKLLEEGRHLLRAAGKLENMVRHVATGWETELRIAVSDILPESWLFPMIAELYAVQSATRIQIMSEVLGGAWDAVMSGRADLTVGAPGDGPAGGGIAARHLGVMEFVFVVAPDHPLANAEEPLADETVVQHRAVAAADSSRSLSPRTTALLFGQDVFTVSDMRAKCEAHRQGLGVGHAPLYLVQDDLDSGRLVRKQLMSPLSPAQLYVAWRSGHTGKALDWFLKRLDEENPFVAILN